MAIGKKVRFEIFKRDGFACRYCGKKPPEVTLEVDHIIAVSQGGSNDPENLLASCFSCNSGKSNIALGTSLVGVINLEAEKEKLAQLKQYEKFLAKKRQYENDKVDIVNEKICEIYHEHLLESGRSSVKKFLKKLPLEEVLEAVEITHARGIRIRGWFKYFCGVCHRKIENNELARG